MGAKTELFPTVPELCATAREVEKNPLSIPTRPIDGKLVLDENFGIFPREFEDYTYSFLLFEAQKIERRLNVDAIASSPQEPAAPLRFTPEQQMESDLHRFVSAQEQESLDNEEERLLRSLREKKAPAQPKPDEVSDYERDHAILRETDDGEAAPLPDEGAAPPPPPPSASSFPRAKPRVLPPKIGQAKASALPGAPQIPSAKPQSQSAPQIPSAKLSAQPALQAPVAKPVASKQGAYEPAYPVSRQPSSQIMPEMAPASEAGEEKKPPAGISSYSKLSPRLQALIDQKLRREEEKAKKARADSDIFKTPPAPPPEEEHEEEPGKALENVDAPNAWNIHDEEEGEAEPSAPAPAGKKAPPSGQDEGEREEIPAEPAAKITRKMPLRKTDDEIAPIPEEEEEQPSLQEEVEAPTPEEEEQAAPSIRQPSRKEKRAMPDEMPSGKGEGTQVPKQAALEEKEEELPRARSKPLAGPVLIQPRFPDAAPSASLQEKQGGSQAEDSDRMRRIQRIIEDLSPDKPRAQPRQEEASFDKEESTEEKEQEGEEAPAQQKEILPPMKKTASAQRKKAPAAQEKPAAPNARQKGLPAKKMQSKAQAKEEPEEIPVAKKPVSRSPIREEPAEEEIPQQRKLTPRAPMREEEREEPEEEMPAAPAKPMRKLVPRIPIREEEDEKPEEEQLPPPKKLKPRLPMREDESEEAEEQPSPVSPARRRILPGMARTVPSTPQTYVPPARERKPIALPPEEPEESEAQGQAADEPEQEAPLPEQEETPSRLAPLKPRKLVSDAAPQESEKTPEQLQQEEKMEKMAKHLARLEAGRIKEVAGTAALPVEEEDIPLPEDDIPKPKDYEQAKESLRKVLEHEETARKVKQEDEITVEQYAKEHLVWLYEIYKMGGMAREDFLQKASEKYSEAQNAAPAPAGGADKDAPANPALAALSKEIEKKDKK